MKNSFLIFTAMSFMAVLVLKEINYEQNNHEFKIRSTSSPKADVKTKKGRQEYFDRLLKDPKTNQIPLNIRGKELKFADELNKKNQLLKTANTEALSWKEAGPNDVGGRTRALAIDINNSNTIIAGGASGGIWKSTDNGVSWSLKSTTSQILSVTSIAQDTRTGHTNTWYYASGEFMGSAQDQGSTHSFSGGGIYKSTDNGETWTLTNSVDTNPLAWNTPYDFVSKIIVNPSTGSVFIASHAFGILRSQDGGNSFTVVLGGTNQHIFSDIDVSSNGTLLAVISSPFNGWTPTNTPGVYKSTNDGTNWTNITPTTFPATHYRSVIEAANNNTAYVLTYTGSTISDKYDDVRFHKINIGTGSSEDRSANMPNFNNDFEDYIHTQNNYNLVLAVKPDDENFVLIGGTSLFRSTNGFSTKPTSTKLDWIGGYHLQYFFYPNFHPDIHSFAFDPNNSKAMWWGHDGGLSYTSDITNKSYSSTFPWTDKNNGYNVTQFYMVAISEDANDTRIIGGTQDNGTPYFRFDGTSTTSSVDVSSGDGSYAYLGSSYAYASVQNGLVLRLNYDIQGNPARANGWSNITPQDATNQLFINPYIVDPTDENIMIYPSGNSLWRNNQLNSLPSNQTFDTGITTGWTQLTNLSLPSTYTITAINVTKSSPTHRVYYAGVDFAQTPSAPKIYKLDNANTATSGAVDISISALEAGSYIHNIAINPENGNELMVVISNYNVVGLYHSIDAGQTFTAVEGNLEGDANIPGPSIRGASILPTASGTQYFVGTSTGVYSTLSLNGSNTAWIQEGSNSIGNVIVNYIASRKSDGKIVAGTHGRGAFVTNAPVGGSAVASVNVNNLTLQAKPGSTGSSSFVLSNTGAATLTYNISVTGSFNTVLPKTTKVGGVLDRSQLNSPSLEKYRDKRDLKKLNNSIKNFDNPVKSKSLTKMAGDDYMILDDGDQTADTFLGWNTGAAFDWLSEFNVEGNDFELDSFEFFMRTEFSFSNDVYVALYNQNSELIDEGTISFGLSTDGAWFGVTLTPAVQFNDGETFYIELYSNEAIGYPAGTDYDASVPNKSYYHNGTDWVSVNTVSGFENAAFLIRAYGTKNSSNNNLVTVNPTSGTIAPGASQTISLTLDAQNLTVGTYTGEVTVSTNGGNITIPINYLVDVEKISSLPTEFNLNQNYPNPFNPSTVVEFSIPYSTDVNLTVYNSIGEKVTTLLNEIKSAGTYKVTFDAKNLANGIYYYKISTKNFNQTKKMVLIK